MIAESIVGRAGRGGKTKNRPASSWLPTYLTDAAGHARVSVSVNVHHSVLLPTPFLFFCFFIPFEADDFQHPQQLAMKTTSFLLPLFAAATVSAHGFLSTVTINDKSYKGSTPFGSNEPSIIRKVSSPDPNKGADNSALTCGPDAAPASQVADANPGDTFTFDWRGADLSKVRSFPPLLEFVDPDGICFSGHTTLVPC